MSNILDSVNQFFTASNIMITIIITVLSTYITELSTSLINDLIIPLFDTNHNNELEVNKLKNYTITINNRIFKVGSFIISLIRFIIILVIIFLAIHFTKTV